MDTTCQTDHLRIGLLLPVADLYHRLWPHIDAALESLGEQVAGRLRRVGLNVPWGANNVAVFLFVLWLDDSIVALVNPLVMIVLETLGQDMTQLLFRGKVSWLRRSSLMDRTNRSA
jgi:hypothetical protein